MLNEIMKNTKEYVRAFSKSERKKYGQFFTPLSTARYMASLMKQKNERVKILDPGSGNGLLTAALLEALASNGVTKQIEVDLYENDENIQKLLKKNIDVMYQYCGNHGIVLALNLYKDNFILANEKKWVDRETEEIYDVVICNPPYMKIGKNSVESVCMSDIVYGQPNIYFLFMGMAVKLLKTHGEAVFITPRSWTSGLYFKRFRCFLFQQMDVRHVHLFQARNKIFKEERIDSDDVLQETMITYGVKARGQSDRLTIAVCRDADDYGNIQMLEVEAGSCIDTGENRYFLLPTDKKDLEVLNIMRRMSGSVVKEGYRFKTGQIVEFRNREFVSETPGDKTVPLLRSCNISNGKIIFPVDKGKPQYFLCTERSAKNVMKNQNTVFIKRATAKEESRRLQPAVHFAEEFHYPILSTENHLNYLVKIGSSMSVCEVYGFYTLLSSELWERYYRMLNGSTQVNSAELNSMPMPEKDKLQNIGRLSMKYWKQLEDMSLSSDDIVRKVVLA